MTQRVLDAGGQVTDVVEPARGDRPAHELLCDGRTVRLVEVASDLRLPERVDVTGQEPDVGDGVGVEPVGDDVALPHEAAPVVEVHVHTRMFHQIRAQRAQSRSVQVDRTDRADHDLVRHQLPGHVVGLSGAEPVEEPVALRITEDGAADGMHLGERRVHRRAQAERPAVGTEDVRITVLTGVEHRHVDQAPPAQPAVDPITVDAPHRLVLEPGPVRGCGALREPQVRDAVAVVDELVVVPHRSERMSGVCGAQIGIGAVHAVLGAIGVQIIRSSGSVGPDRERSRSPAGGLVDVVAQEDDRVDVLGRDRTPGRVVAGGEALAARDRKAHRRGIGVCVGKRAGAADRTAQAVDPEPVPVGRSGNETFGEHLHTPVVLRRRDSRAGRHHLCELRVGRHLPVELRRTWSEAGPQNDRGVGVHPRRDPAVEGTEVDRRRIRRCRSTPEEPVRGDAPEPECAAPQQCSPIHAAPRELPPRPG